MGFSIVYLVNFYLLGKKVTRKTLKWVNMVRGDYIRIRRSRMANTFTEEKTKTLIKEKKKEKKEFIKNKRNRENKRNL